MKVLHAIAIVTSLLALAVSGPAMAQHRGHFGGPRVSIGFGFGVPFGIPFGYHPYYYPPYPPYYYYPPMVVVPAAPLTYIERPENIQEQYQQQPQYQQQSQGPAQPQPQPQAQASTAPSDWFYCPDSKTYYPYVQQCAGEWQRVTPHPPQGNTGR